MGVELTMKLREAFRKGFSHIGSGQFDSVSILDREGETINVVKFSDLATIEEKYLDAQFLSIGTSALKPDRLRIRIDVLR